MNYKKSALQRILETILLILALMLAILISLLIVDSRHVKFIINGPEYMTVEAGTKFVDPGVRVITNGRLFKESSDELSVKANGKVDTARVGEYEYDYTVNYLFHNFTASRKVMVVDTTAPEIILKHRDDYRPDWMTGYEEEGFTANDTVDGDLTAKVQREQRDGCIVYTVTDANGNKAEVTRELAGMQKPQILLSGGESITQSASTSFRDPGFTVYDAYGNDLSEYVTITGEVYSYSPGEYDRVYTLTSATGEEVSVTRHISITQVKNPETVLPDQNTIYLTFDDGPGPYTSELLDILAKYNVKATFFVTNGSPKYQDMIGRAYREGHAIGVHTYTHDYRKIYSSEEAYMNDFNAMEEIIYDQTGSYTRLFRFPGGSSNTVSRDYCSGIMSRLTSNMESMGYVYFDWNVLSGDAGETTDTKKVRDNVINGVSGKRASVVLQHDIKGFSVDAVEDIILWGLNNGYAFQALNETSFTAHHGVNN